MPKQSTTVAARSCRAALAMSSLTISCSVSRNEIGQPRLVNRDLVGIQHLDLALVHVRADDFISGFGETRSHHQTNVPGPYHGDMQGSSSGFPNFFTPSTHVPRGISRVEYHLRMFDNEIYVESRVVGGNQHAVLR